MRLLISCLFVNVSVSIDHLKTENNKRKKYESKSYLKKK